MRSANERTAEPAELEGFNQYLLASFQKIWPALKGQLKPEESVEMVLEVIETLTAEQSGFMISHHGNEDWI
jgi:hypothetical protein